MIGEFDKKAKADNAHVIYHGHCNDGFGAFWAFNQLADYGSFSQSSEEGHYGKPPALLNNADLSKYDLWILDFSYPWNTLVDLASKFNQVVVIDHHKTFIDSLQPIANSIDVDNYKAPSNLTIIWDLERSGAGLTWDYLAQLFTPSGFKRPYLINYIEDRDIWKHKLPHTKEINAVIAATPKTIVDYNELQLDLAQSSGHVVKTGEALLGQHQRICQDIVSQSQRCILYEGETKHVGLISNCTGHFASDVGTLLAEKSGSFGATWITESDGSVKFSLRSIGDYDVSAIAKSYGGGGHKNAAGFVIRNPTSNQDGIVIWNHGVQNLEGLPQGGI